MTDALSHVDSDMPSHPDFFDEARVFVAAGKGGEGCIHFRHEKYVPLGGPDGGDGGNGGSVVLEADPMLNTLISFRYKRRFVAQDGAPGTGNRRHGKQAADVVVKVPVGTTIHDGETDALLADLAHGGAHQIVTRGGQGGLGNSHFATSTRQAPDFAEKGQPGEERWLRLELKLVADVGLVGLPNAGKSTLLASMSAARPKIADYPFTTLIPNLGVVALDDYSFVAADIPGLIEGAHAGRGLGDQFLRHIIRTRILLRILDASSPHPMADFAEVTKELRLYDSTLLAKPQVVALTKLDLPDARKRSKELTRRLKAKGLAVFSVSGVTHEGMPALLTGLRLALEELPARHPAVAPTGEAEPEEHVITARADPDDFVIQRKRATFTVSGQTAERVVSMTDMDSPEGLERLQRQLKRLGVIQALERAGVQAGNRVRIGAFEMTWEGELEPGLAKPSEQKASGSRRRTHSGTRASRGRRLK